MGAPCTGCLDLSKDCEKVKTGNVIYNGPNLPCSNINTNDSLTVALQKLDEKLCTISGGQTLQETLVLGNIATDIGAVFVSSIEPLEFTEILSSYVLSPAFIKIGGLGSEYLMADGTVTTADNIIADIITQFIVNGDVTHAPSGNAIYDALLLKADISQLHSPVTIGTANGLSIVPATQVLSMALSSTSTTGTLTSTDWNTFNNKQDALINPITGLGTVNTLSKFITPTTLGDSSITDTGSLVTITNPLRQTGTINASSGAAKGTLIEPLLVATATNNVLVGLDIAPNYSNGAFTGVINAGIRLRDISIYTQKNSTGVNYPVILWNEPFNLTAFGSNLTNTSISGGYIDFVNNTGVRQARLFNVSGDFLLQNGGVYSDFGYRLDVQGTVRLGNTTTLQTAPITSAGTFDILTRNTVSGVVEKILSTAVISGSGTLNTVPKFTPNGTTLGDSTINDTGTGPTGRVNINNFIGGTVTRVLPSGNTSIGQILNITGTDATSNLTNNFTFNNNEDGFNGVTKIASVVQIVNNKSTNQTSNIRSFDVLLNQSGTGSLSGGSVIRALLAGTGTGNIGTLTLIDSNSSAINNSFNIGTFYGFNLPFTPQNNVTNSYGIKIGDLFGSNVSRAIDTNVSSGSGKYNIYAQGTANNYFGGNIGLGIVVPISGASGSKWLTANGTTTYGGGFISSVSGVGKAFYFSDSGFALVQGAAGEGVKLIVNGSTDALTALSNGNVGIGITNPLYKLDVSGTVRMSNTVTLEALPTTSAGTYDILTRNTATGIVEKIAAIASNITATPHVDYLTASTVQGQLDNTETAIVALVRTDKTDFKDLYQTGRVRVDTDTSVLSISPANTLNITACDNILFINEVVIDVPANKIANFLLSFGNKSFVVNNTNTPLAANTRGVFYVALDKLGNPVYRPAKVYDQDVCYLARIIVENVAGTFNVVSFKYFPDLANNRVNNHDRLTLSSGYIVPSGAASISFGNRGFTYSKNSINYSNNKLDPNYLTVADSVNPAPMQFLYALPNLTSLATSIALSTVINPTQWYNAGGTVGGGAVANANYQVYKLLVTVTGTIVIQTKASTSNAPAPGINAIFANRDDALAGLTSTVFPDILPIGDSIGLGTFYLRAGTAANGSTMNDPNDFYFRPFTSTSSSSTVGVTAHDLLSGKNDNVAYQHVTTTNIGDWNLAYTNRITALTTTGSSGAATLIANTLNIPNYSLAGLGLTPSPLTKVDDTNVTLTLGGTPGTALLQATSLTLGWTGTLADARITSAATWHAKQNALTGDGFVRAVGGVISYDNTVYYPASNPNGYTSNPGTIVGGGSPGYVAFWDGATSIAGNPALFWDNPNARLGIGTISPSEKLEVNGNVKLLGNDVTLSLGSGTNFSAIKGETGNIRFYSGTDTYHERMQITSDGNVGIGTTSPFSRLSIKSSLLYNVAGTENLFQIGDDASSDSALTGFFINKTQNGASSGTYTIGCNDSGGNLFNLAFHTNGAERMRIDRSGNITMTGSLSVAGTVTAASDARLKTNIVPIENALDKVLKTNGVKFDRTDNGIKGQLGFIAQELEEVLPELVETDNTETGMKSVNYQAMVAVLVEAIKELEKRILILESK